MYKYIGRADVKVNGGAGYECNANPSIEISMRSLSQTFSESEDCQKEARVDEQGHSLAGGHNNPVFLFEEADQHPAPRGEHNEIVSVETAAF